MASYICPVGLQGTPPTWRSNLVAILACHSVTKGPLWPSNSTFFVNGPSSCWQDLFLQKVRRWNTSCTLNHLCFVGIFRSQRNQCLEFRGSRWYREEFQRSWVVLLGSPWKPQLPLLRCDEEPNPTTKTNIPSLAVRPTGDTLLGLSWALLLLRQILV